MLFITLRQGSGYSVRRVRWRRSSVARRALPKASFELAVLETNSTGAVQTVKAEKPT